jgi:hypothetical protein
LTPAPRRSAVATSSALRAAGLDPFPQRVLDPLGACPQVIESFGLGRNSVEGLEMFHPHAGRRPGEQLI